MKSKNLYFKRLPAPLCIRLAENIIFSAEKDDSKFRIAAETNI
jgi:hypothetical protein